MQSLGIYKAMFESATTGILIVDKDGNEITLDQSLILNFQT